MAPSAPSTPRPAATTSRTSIRAELPSSGPACTPASATLAAWHGSSTCSITTRQLAFLDDIGLFHVGRRRAVAGGVRTEVYDNAIRVDNVRHAPMALLEVLDPPHPEQHGPSVEASRLDRHPKFDGAD